MRTIAIINQKGGCGKTTVSINLAAVLARSGKRTLLVDVDPQAHCALGLAVPEAQIERSVADLLRHGLDGSIGVRDVTWQVARDFDLAPSGISLAALEQELALAPDRDRRLAQVLAAVDEDYDYCIIDCPPSIGLLTFNALRAASEVIVPVETGYFSMQGSMKQEATIEMLARRAHHHVRFSVLATMYDGQARLAREILAELQRHFADRLLPVVVHFSNALREAASFGQPITEYEPEGHGVKDFERLAQWLAQNPPAAPRIEPSHPGNPGLSRAAELVERARALSARTAALSARLQEDQDTRDEGVVVASPHGVLRQEEADGPPVGAGSNAGARPAALQEKLQRLYGVRQTRQGMLFVQPAPAADGQAAIVGDFNGWAEDANLMEFDDELGIWQACLHLPPGRYQYRLVLDGQWRNDPYNGRVEPGAQGEMNNVLEVGQ